MALGTKIQGAALTLRGLGARGLLLEALRRLMGRPYRLGGLLISDHRAFRALRAVSLRGYGIRISDGALLVETPWALLSAPIDERGLHIDLLAVLSEDLEGMYGALDVDGRVVLDIGAYMGETTLLFLWRGARRVVAFEPVRDYFEILKSNIELNGAGEAVDAFNRGVWRRHGPIQLEKRGVATGLWVPAEGKGNASEALSLGEALSIPGTSDLAVKMDCEGCEYSLLVEPCNTLTRATQYVVEIHGSPTILIDKMNECGYRAELVRVLHKPGDLVPLSIWSFTSTR